MSDNRPGSMDPWRLPDFRTYADDSLRIEDRPRPLSQPDEPFPSPYPEHQTPTGEEELEAATPARRSVKPWGVALLVTATVASVALTLPHPARWLRETMASATTPSRPATGEPRRLTIEAAAPAPTPTSPNTISSRLEVLRPADIAPALAPPPTLTEAPVVARLPPQTGDRAMPAPDPRAARRLAEGSEARIMPPLEQPRPPELRGQIRLRLPAGLECGEPNSFGEAEVCRYPGLVAADRRLIRAYAVALAAGANARDLEDEQDDWLEAREDAARRPHRELEALYHRRIQELEAMGSRPQER
jgi:hypothetical protein